MCVCVCVCGCTEAEMLNVAQRFDMGEGGSI